MRKWQRETRGLRGLVPSEGEGSGGLPWPIQENHDPREHGPALRAPGTPPSGGASPSQAVPTPQPRSLPTPSPRTLPIAGPLPSRLRRPTPSSPRSGPLTHPPGSPWLAFPAARPDPSPLTSPQRLLVAEESDP